MVEKKYQIFISSTYKDLINARKKVMEEVLSMGHFPVGMESFTAGDEEQWEIIESELATTDYYILILGKRYGSLSPEGIGYTEKEFDYAEGLGIPILSFVRDENIAFTDDERETDPKLIKKFNNFRKKVMTGRMIKEWKEINELPGLVSTALNKQITRKPRLGWIRGDQTVPPETLMELTRLSKENSLLREELTELKKNALERVPKLEVEINGTSQLEIELSKLPFRRPELIEDNFLTDNQKNDKELLEEVENYNRVFEHVELVNNYFDQVDLYRRAQKKEIKLEFSITNIGSMKANSINVELSFPEELKILSKHEIIEMEEPVDIFPEYPLFRINPKFKSQATAILPTLYGTRGSLSGLKLSNFNYDSLNPNKRISKEDNKVNLYLNSLLHGSYMKKFESDFYLIPLKKGHFEIEASIICEEYAQEEKCSISVIVN